MQGSNYPQEVKDFYWKNVIDAGVPRTGAVARAIMVAQYGNSPSKSTLQYWWHGDSEREKIKVRTVRYRTTNPFVIVGRRLDLFKSKSPRIETGRSIWQQYEHANRDTRVKFDSIEPAMYWVLNSRISRFQGKGTERGNMPIAECSFYAKDVLEFWEDSQGYDKDTYDLDCTICGEQLNVVHDVWHMDHIDPSAGNHLENSSCTHKECNQSKSSMQMEEYLKHIEIVLRNHNRLPKK